MKAVNEYEECKSGSEPVFVWFLEGISLLQNNIRFTYQEVALPL